MKTKNIFTAVLLTVITLFMASCEDDAIVREPSPEANPNSTNVYFSSINSSSFVLGVDATSFKLAILRDKSDAAQDVSLSLESPTMDAFTIPSSVSFAAGEDSVEFDVILNDLELMKEYSMSILVDGEQTNPYVDQMLGDSTLVYSRMDLTVLKEDFVPYSEGTFTSSMFGDSWAVIMDYSPSLAAYRLNDLIENGYDLLFSVNEDGGLVQIPTDPVKSGYDHSTYGMISMQIQAGSAFDATSDTYTLMLKYTVAAGSFGTKEEVYVVTMKY